MIKERLLRLREVLHIIPVSKSTWYEGITKGIYPRGNKLRERTTVKKIAEHPDE